MYIRYREKQIVASTCVESGLTKKEELALIRRARAGDRVAETKVFEANLRLVKLFAAYRRINNPTFSAAELYTEGLWGLFAAYKRFDTRRNVRLATYAINWVKVYMDRYIDKNGPVVHTHGTKGRTNYDYHFMSLDTPVHSGQDFDDDMTFKDLVADKSPLPDQLFADVETRSVIREVVRRSRLTALERNIVEHRLLLEDMTLEEIGSRTGVSRERVRQVEVKLRPKLARLLRQEGYGE